MPFPFVLPTTSGFSFASSFICESHPSLPLSANTYRGVVKDTLKKHKRLPPSAQISNLATVTSSLQDYIPYLLTIDAGLNDNQLIAGDTIKIVVQSQPAIEWRPTLSDDPVPGRERPRVKLTSLDHEIAFVFSTLGFSHVLKARSALQPLHATGSDFIGTQDRANAITAAMRSLLDAVSVWDFLGSRAEHGVSSLPCVDVAPAMIRSLAAAAHAEATLLAVLKDDPYPAAVAQDRNKNDKEWMFKSPEIPKVRAHLYARLCLAAAEHAAKASSLCQSASAGTTKVNPAFSRYVDDLRRTSRAKACRFFGIGAEMEGQTAEGIGWLYAGLQELGVEIKENKKGLSLSRFKKEFADKREDRRVEKEAAWGSDAGKAEETRVIEMLSAKWNKINDTMNTQAIPPANSLLLKMPSGREIHTIKPYEPPVLDAAVLETMRATPEVIDDYANDLSSDDDMRSPSGPVGAFPGTSTDYTRSPSTAGNTYY
ncbi:pH-response regulator protein palC [Paramyrothecium foliicola]|nr:pH-response regulator protein palC [Paramyrothecium foliicola]